MSHWLSGENGLPRPPLAWRLVGLAVGLILLAAGLFLLLITLRMFIPLVPVLLVVAYVYRLLLGRSPWKK